MDVIKRAKLGCVNTTATSTNIPVNINNPVAK
jgi:hypothetical protein